MTKKKKKPAAKSVRLAKKAQKSENTELDHLPAQADDSICLYETDVEYLKTLENAGGYREGLVNLKQKFLWEIQEFSKRVGLKAELRVFFTLKPEE